MAADASDAPQSRSASVQLDVINTLSVPASQTVEIHVRFEVWNDATYEPLSNMKVELMDDDVVGADKLLAQDTDAQGIVHFSSTMAELRRLAKNEAPDLYFLAHPAGRIVGGRTLPARWATKGWKDTNNHPGYYEDFTGTQIGSSAAPLTFRVGVDFHLQLTYLALKRSGTAMTQRTLEGPPGIPVGVLVGAGITPTAVSRTNAEGVVHGVVFDVSPEDDIAFMVRFEIADDTIQLKRAFVDMDRLGGQMRPMEWSTSSDDADRKTSENYFPDNILPSIGNPGRPKVLHCATNDRNVALYFLKTWRELSVFLFHLTAKAWLGVENLRFTRWAPQTAFSWPVGQVNIPPSSFWERDTLIHELGHQVMWQEAGFSSVTIALLALSPSGLLCLNHFSAKLADSSHALIEGWAEFLELVFESSTALAVNQVAFQQEDNGTLIKPKDLHPPSAPLNLGYQVEGAFANGLWEIFWNHVVGSSATHKPVAERADGDVTKSASWLVDPLVGARFRALIWTPLQQLKSSWSFLPPKPAATTDFVKSMRANTKPPAQWYQLVRYLNDYNMAMEPPVIKTVSPPFGPTRRSEPMTLNGENFVDGQTEVKIGGAAWIVPKVLSAEKITFDIPAGNSGEMTEIIVKTKAGTGRMSYRYND